MTSRACRTGPEAKNIYLYMCISTRVENEWKAIIEKPRILLLFDKLITLLKSKFSQQYVFMKLRAEFALQSSSIICLNLVFVVDICTSQQKLTMTGKKLLKSQDSCCRLGGVFRIFTNCRALETLLLDSRF